MAFTARTRAAIRDELLSNWSSRYAAIGSQLLTVPGSDAYMLADTLSVTLELFEQQAQTQTKAILPDQADTDSLTRHGQVDGVSKDPATGAILTAGITGTASSTITFGTAVLTYNGVSYGSFKRHDTGATITSVTLNGSGNPPWGIDVQATSTGSSTTIPISTTLTWSSTPTNANTTAPVTAIVVPGTDDETDASYANRIIARRQSRPASGNRADWAGWVGAYSGVIDTYVYPLLQPPGSFPGAGTPGTLGCVTVVPLSVAPGDTPGNPYNNRVLGGSAGASLSSTGSSPNIGAYIEGTADASGNAVTNGTQLRPVTIAVTDYSIEAVQTQAQVVEIQAVMSSAYAFPWAYNASFLVLSSPTTTTFKISGNHLATVFPGGTIYPVLVHVGTTNYRGGYYMVTPTSITFDGTNTVFVVPTLPGTPQVGEIVLPAPANFGAIRTAMMALFDTLGPGDTSPPSRWPTEDTKGRSVLYPSMITGRVVQELDSVGNLLSGVRGVLAATMVTPSGTVTPPGKTLLVLGRLSVHV